MEEQAVQAELCWNKYGFPDAVLIVDGSHIPIRKPTQHQRDYINRKSNSSIIAQLVCDFNMIFRHDQRILL